MAESNATIIRGVYDGFSRGDMEAVFAAFDPDIAWHIPGHGPLSGDYKGHAPIQGFFGHLMELANGGFRLDLHQVLAEGDVVVCLVTVNPTRNGVSARFPEVHVWTMRNGKAVKFREYQGDEQTEDRFWS